MPRRAPFAVLLCLGAVAILASPATAITLTNHVLIPHGVTRKDDLHRVVVTTVAPPDSDDDGCKNSRDSYNGPGCNEPAPTVAAPVQSVAPSTPTYTSVPAAPVGSCPASLAGESTSPTAVNPSSGAAGCIQALPSTWAAYGDPAYASAADAPVSVQMEAMARICAAQGNDAWTAADPCG